jgi:hypothetical protein
MTKVEALQTALAGLMPYRAHLFGCDEAMFDACTCGMREAADAARRALALPGDGVDSPPREAPMATIPDRSIEVWFGPAGMMIHVPHDFAHVLLEEVEERGGPGPAFTELRDAIALRLASEEDEDEEQTFSAEEMSEVLNSLAELVQASESEDGAHLAGALARARGILDQGKAKGL